MCCVIGYTGHDMSTDKFKEYLMRTVSRGKSKALSALFQRVRAGVSRADGRA